MKWKPERITPNKTAGIITRRQSAIIAEYRRQGENDEAILQVLADIHVPSDGEDVPGFTAPEYMHTVDSMETLDINLWEHVFRDERWKTFEPVRQVREFESTHPGGTLGRRLSTCPPEEVPHSFAGVYTDWSSARAGWAVLVPNRFLYESSFHTGDTPSWTQGDIVGEGTLVGTGRRMVIVDLGGYNSERHMDHNDVRVANGPGIRAVGSEGGHGYGWKKRQHNFSPRSTVLAPTGGGTASMTHSAGMGSADGAQAEGGRREETEHIADNDEPTIWGSQPAGAPINDYDEPSDEEGLGGTQNSTARMTFPKVSESLPDYMISSKKKVVIDSDGSGEDAEEEPAVDVDSSDREWFPEFDDTIESDGADFDLNLDADDEDLDDERAATGMESWCMQEEAFIPTRLTMAELEHHYRKEAWSLASVDFIRSRDNFTGPTPGLKDRTEQAVPDPWRVFDLYWSDSVVDRIAVETNRYAATILSRDGEDPPRTKGGPTWKDVDRSDIRGWLGICILMGCKRLPSVKHYWMLSEPFIYCQLISQVMSLRRWQQILSCLHLVDNAEVVRDTKDSRFDKIAKTRWLVENFVEVSEAIYNLEREITVDECVIPYKGKYCFIRQFMPDKPIRFGIKVWLLASSKSRFVWWIEVYFGEGTGVGEHGLGYHVVQRMVEGLGGRGHCLVVDNLFASVNLFHELMVMGIWATGTVRKNSKNLPSGLYRKTDKAERGSMLIRTHVHRQMGVLSWQDKKLVTILSTAVPPWAPGVSVLRREKGRSGRLIVPSSPMHTQYTEYMRGVDVTDQLRSTYSSQLRCHKWWLKIFHFIVDQSLVNAYVTWVREMEDRGLRKKPHLAFKIAVGRHLVEGAI